MAYFDTALNHILLGEVARARESAGQMREVGEASADERLQSYAAWATGWALAVEGRTAEAIVSCRLALALATDPVSTAYAVAHLGYAYLEAGDSGEAEPRLAEALEHFARFRFRGAEARFRGLLAEARRLEGQLDEAARLATTAHAQARAFGDPHTAGWAQRTLGRVALARGATDEAEHMLGEALETFRAIEAELESGRTVLDLSAAAASRGDVARARGHIESARARFVGLGVSAHVARADTLAERLT